jgi:hypothetical protein
MQHKTSLAPSFVSLFARAQPFSVARRCQGRAQKRVAACCLLAVASFTACLPATNPCDPASDPSIRRTASISGMVVDQAGAPVAGVPVFISGAGDSKVSGDDGTFTFPALLPNDDGRGYEIIAVPQAPIAGGRAVADSLGCNEAQVDVLVPVVVPPASPEVEITQATAPDRLFVAFAAASDKVVDVTDVNLHATINACDAPSSDITYRVEVRAPFGTWLEAVLAHAPVPMGEAGVIHDDAEGTRVVSVSTLGTVDDACARATCGYYSYAYASLAENTNARCAEVVGYRTASGEPAPLTAYERYEVRVRADVHVADSEARALPKIVSSSATAAPGELSLTPTAVLPVPMAGDDETDATLRADIDIRGAAPINKNRFALIDREGMVVVGGGTLSDGEIRGVMGMDPAISEGMVVDNGTTADAMDEIMTDSGDAAISLLPAGKWVRVWKRRAQDSMIDKVFVGAFPGDAPQNANPPQPVFDVDMLFPGAADAFRGFHWLARPAGTLVGGPYDPPDAYLLLFAKGIVILEQQPAGSSETAMMDGATTSLIDASFPTTNGAPGSLCAAVNALGVVTTSAGTTYGACWDLRTLNPSISLADLQILATDPESTDPATTFHIFADEAGDEVVVIKSEHLLLRNLPDSATSIVDVVRTLRVGLNPSALQPTQMLDCANDTKRPVMVVANRGSQDLSILALATGGVSASHVVETAVVPLPAVPVRFFADPVGPTCEDPYLWVVADDGRTFPVDMRIDRLSIPLCGSSECAVETRSRARVGAVGRNEKGRGRVLLGGKGVLSEVGFLRPAHTPTFVIKALD